jgi:hypothetical protein
VEAQDLNPEDRDRVNKFLSNPLDFPPEFKKWLLDYLAQNIPPVPVSQLLGFVQTRAHVADPVPDFNETSSSVYTDLAIVGPSLAGLADGTYLVFHGCEFASFDGFEARGWMALSVNGAAAADSRANRCFLGGTRHDTSFRGEAVICANGDNNTITAMYRSSVGVTDFGRRWLIAIRVS